jgi:hypothetical protein
MSVSAKCFCQHCSGHLEFDVEHIGTMIECPHCQMETPLYRAPGLSPATASRSRRWLNVVLAAALLLVVAGGAYCGFTYWTATESATETASFGITFFGLLGGFMVGVLLLVLAVFWLLFPVLTYLQLRRIEKLLENPARKI